MHKRTREIDKCVYRRYKGWKRPTRGEKQLTGIWLASQECFETNIVQVSRYFFLCLLLGVNLQWGLEIRAQDYDQGYGPPSRSKSWAGEVNQVKAGDRWVNVPIKNITFTHLFLLSYLTHFTSFV